MNNSVYLSELLNFDSRFGIYVKFPARGQMFMSKIEFLASNMKKNSHYMAVSDFFSRKFRAAKLP